MKTIETKSIQLTKGKHPVLDSRVEKMLTTIIILIIIFAKIQWHRFN